MHEDGRSAADRLKVQEIELEMLRRGAGRAILLLHGFDTVDAEAPFLDRLARRGEVIAPSAPGFGHTPRPENFDTVYDLVHLYLALSRRCRRTRRRARALVWRLARGRGRGCLQPPDRQADPGRPGRHQDQRPRDAGHPRHLQQVARRGAAPQLARPRPLRPRLQRDVGRGAGRACAQPRGALSLCVASLYVQPAIAALARRIACLPWCCGARATAW